MCDDGKDKEKCKWCQRMGLSVVYVSGRIRGEKEMNGKSANLNNCLEQIYPADKGPIPHNELVSPLARSFRRTIMIMIIKYMLSPSSSISLMFLDHRRDN